MLFVDVRSHVQLVCDTGVSDGRTDGHCDGRMTGSESFQSAVYSRPTGCGVVAQRRFSVVCELCERLTHDGRSKTVA